MRDSRGEILFLHLPTAQCPPKNLYLDTLLADDIGWKTQRLHTQKYKKIETFDSRLNKVVRLSDEKPPFLLDPGILGSDL